MLICMARTTLNLSDALMSEVKRHAADTGRTVTALVETALRDLIDRERRRAGEAFVLEWPVTEGGVQPGVDLADRDALIEVMDESS